MTRVVLLVVALAGCTHAVPRVELVKARAAQRLLFHDVTLFAATSENATAHVDVVVDGAVITEVRPTAPVDATTTAQVIEGAGKTLMPGLIDVHGHPTGSGSPFWYIEYPDPAHNLAAHLYVGVTTVFAPGGETSKLKELSADVERGALLGPRVLYAGKMIAKRNGYPPAMVRKLLPFPLGHIAADQFAIEVDGVEQARAAAKENLAQGASFLKVAVTQLPTPETPRLSLEELRAVVEVARGANVRVVAHIDDVDDALLCARAGIDALWHNIELHALSDDDLKALASLAAVAPTLSTFQVFADLAEGRYELWPAVTATESPGVLDSLIRSKEYIGRTPPELAAWVTTMAAHSADRKQNAKRLYDAHIPLLVGTDANAAQGSFPASIQREAKAMHDVGIPNADILLGATSRAARFMVLGAGGPSFGTVEVGKAADLLLVDGDPLSDIEALARVALVVKGGRVIDRLDGFSR